MTPPDDTREQWLVLRPRDAVQVRDGRTFGAGDAAHTVRPLPSTLGGAIRTAHYGKDVDTVCGPFPARRQGDTWLPYFPVPADLVHSARNGRVTRLRVPQEQLTEVTTDLDASATLRPMTCPDGGDPFTDRYLPGDVLQRYLTGRLRPDMRRYFSDGLLKVRDPFVEERRVGLAREDRVAVDGMLYQASYLRLRESPDEWALLARCGLEPDDRRGFRASTRFGGKGRLADVEQATSVTWPAPPEAFPDGRLLMYVATPALWGSWDGEARKISEPETTCWRPSPMPEGATLEAAVVPDAVPVATASVRDDGGFWKSRRLRWAVPAGSVYLLRFDDPARAADWAAKHHGRPYGRPAKDRLATVGFGIIMTGVWA